MNTSKNSKRRFTDRGFTKFIVALICFGCILLFILSWFDSNYNSSIIHNIITHPLNESEIYHWRDIIEDEIEIDPKQFCDIPIDYYDKNADDKIYYNSYTEKLTRNDIEELKKLRLKEVPMCQSPHGNLTSFNQYKQLLSILPPNLVGYANKCVIKPIKRLRREMGGFIAPNSILIRNNKSDTKYDNRPPLLGFIHVFKSGGTSVRDTMRRLTQGLSRLTWHQYASQFRAFLSDLFVFSFVRDPIDRFLSSHFELRRRNYTILASSQQTGIHSVQWLLKSIKNRLDCALAKDKKNNPGVDINIENIYYNIHILPQMLFLTNHSNPWGFLPINYIGFTTDIFNSTFEILYELYMKYNPPPTMSEMSEWNKNDAYNTFKELYIQGRDRHSIDYLNNSNLMIHPDAKLDPMDLLQFQVESSDLTDNDISKICEIYWMDYLCLPFDIPPQCNLTKLFIKHYGDNIVYNDCWDFTEQQYDAKFVDDMLNGRISTENNKHPFSFANQFAQRLKGRKKGMFGRNPRVQRARFPDVP